MSDAPVRGRTALITATSDHYASVSTWRRTVAESPWLPSRALSVMEPVSAMLLHFFQ